MDNAGELGLKCSTRTPSWEVARSSPRFLSENVNVSLVAYDGGTGISGKLLAASASVVRKRLEQETRLIEFSKGVFSEDLGDDVWPDDDDGVAGAQPQA